MTAPSLDVIRRNNVHVTGNPSGQPILFVHGFGGSQQSWRYITPEFQNDYKIVLLDLVGSGNSDVAAYDRGKYDSLHGYVDDVLEVIDTLDLRDVILIGHSVSGIIGLLASNRRPELFSKLVLIGPSPRYLNDDGYPGGFSRQAVDEILDSLDSNYMGWSATMGSTLMGNAERPELAEGLADTIGAINPAIASQFARVTFLSDNRRDLADVTTPTLILQSSEDVIAGLPVGQFVHESIAGSQFVVMTSRGHVPILSAPLEVARHISAFLT